MNTRKIGVEEGTTRSKPKDGYQPPDVDASGSPDKMLTVLRTCTSIPCGAYNATILQQTSEAFEEPVPYWSGIWYQQYFCLYEHMKIKQETRLVKSIECGEVHTCGTAGFPKWSLTNASILY